MKVSAGLFFSHFLRARGALRRAVPLLSWLVLGACPGLARAAGEAPSAPARSPVASSAPAPGVARGIDAAVDLRPGEGALRFSFPVRAPAWYLWQQATDCQSYVRSIKEVKRCEYLQQEGKTQVLLVAELLGRTYTVVVGVDRSFHRGRGKIEFESRNTGLPPTRGSLRIEPDGDGQARLHFDATMPRDAEVPELLWRLGVAAVIQSSAAKIQQDLEEGFRDVKAQKELLPDVQLRTRLPARRPQTPKGLEPPKVEAPPPSPTLPRP